MKRILILILTGLAPVVAAPELVSLFDGKTFKGWKIQKGEERWWKVRDGLIVGGDLEKEVPQNTWLVSEGSYQNFELFFSVRMVAKDGFDNSGMQIRSISKGKHMSGYQVDIGRKWWGKMYDEHRRNKVIAEPVDSAALAKVIKETDWNHYRVLAEGPRIRSWINGVAALDYTEKDPKIPLDGQLGMQAHGGGRFEVQFKDIRIRKLPPTPGAPTWAKPALSRKQTKQAEKQKQLGNKSEARSAQDQLASFKVPKGFVVELVASEEQGVNKPVTVQWDTSGRMWTMTAVEYPIDANENRAQAEAKYASGGRDRVLVFDDPYGPGPHTPREFANGLVIPLGMLPTKDGAYVQYGTELRHYNDRDRDGKAEGYDVVLKGFGIQDSHLFPHQFERAPGGWIYLAQGLFNKSTVVRPDGTPFGDGSPSVRFDFCKLARFRTDVSAFETLTSGPNNIWGFTQKNTGEIFLQEANDVGIPVAEYERGIHYPTGLKERLKPYAPALPASFKGRVMGGTGLSGLALIEDSESAFNAGYGEAENVFFLANPITNRIQVVTTKRGSHGHHQYTKEKDFLTSTDSWFRPVAVHFGPDGCLYVVDWYNKIISHNEVPRNHPDRDKVRGRIWRIRSESGKVQSPPDLMKVPADELVDQLANPNERIARFAWHAIADRGEKGLNRELEKKIQYAPKLNTRVLAFWALEDLGGLTPDLLATLVKDQAPEIRFEAVRALGNLRWPEEDNLRILRAVVDDPNYRVRAELANTIRSLPEAGPELLMLAATLGNPPTKHGDRRDYDRSFERYLARWAMENHSASTREMLASSFSSKLNDEQRLLAMQTLPASDAGPVLLKAAASLGRPLEVSELSIIVPLLGAPDVAAQFRNLLAKPDVQEVMLERLGKLDAPLRHNSALAGMLEPGCADMLKRDSSSLPKVTTAAKRLRLTGLGQIVAARLTSESPDAEVVSILAALREMGVSDAKLYRPFEKRKDPDVQRQVVMGLAASPDPKLAQYFAERWSDLSGDLRQLVAIGLTSSKEKAAAFASLAARGEFSGLTPEMVKDVVTALGPSHPDVKRLLAATPGMIEPVIRLTGKPGDSVIAGVTLEGPFTVESWVKFDKGISNDENLLGRKGDADFNFFGGRLRVWGGPKLGDLIAAKRTLQPDVWVHCAVTRDAQGRFRIYHDGELDSDQGKAFGGTFENLDIGTTNHGKGAHMRIREFRVWNRARTAEEIRDYHQTALPNESRHPGLAFRVSGDSEGVKLRGKAYIEATTDFPALITPKEAASRKAKFERMLDLVKKPGEVSRGRPYFAACLACHKVGDAGGVIGPDLSGVGVMDDEALLRNILYPNAAMESGYYRHDVLRKDGSKITGSLVEETAAHLTIRPIAGEVVVVPKAEILSHSVSKTSLMPEGLIDHLDPQQVADLFAYIRSLKGPGN